VIQRRCLANPEGCSLDQLHRWTLGGCCAGRPTSSRWGLWSSDRRMGARRIPVQLLESGTALLLGAGATAAVPSLGTSDGGLVFVAAVAAYTAARQVLFALRDLPRATEHGRQVTLGISVPWRSSQARSS
jgi:phosphatidylglycerol:prolipoprotein diacylglycerol transferase